MTGTGTSRGLRDEMNVGPDPRGSRQLVPLRELGRFRLASGEPDIRGWTVFTSTGREIGRVHELLADVDAKQVVMLDIDLRRDDRHTLAPIRSAWVDQATRRVVIDASAVTTGDELPVVTGERAPGAAAAPAAAERVVEGRVVDERVIDERVIERPPVVEEVVVRRREVAEPGEDTLLEPRPGDASGPSQ